MIDVDFFSANKALIDFNDKGISIQGMSIKTGVLKAKRNPVSVQEYC